MASDTKEIVSSLEGAVIREGRRQGNTTRIIDNAIQLIFDGKKVKVESDIGNPYDAHFVFHAILKRMYAEHPGVMSDLSVNEPELSIEWRK